MARILVIDDEETARYTVRAYLESAGHGVVEAEDAHIGLDLHAGSRFDLVIIDIFMPRLDGLAAIKALRRRDPELPIIAVSGGGKYNRLEPLIKSAEAGANGRMIKPFTKDGLLGEVRRVVAT